LRYWDSSAITPLLIAENASGRAREIQAEDPAIVTWWGTFIECVSAFARLHREGQLTSAELGRSITRARRDLTTWIEVGPSDDVREQSVRLLRVHALRAADAVHLAAAIIASDFQPGTLEFFTLDRNQRAAADKEGFRVIG
jgi:predicted nucleic acid-binding protein